MPGVPSTHWANIPSLTLKSCFFFKSRRRGCEIKTTQARIYGKTPHTPPPLGPGSAMHTMHTQCEVLDVGEYSNPTEGYTPAALAVCPAAHLRRALGIIPSANKTRNSLYWIHYFLTLHPFALCNTSLVTLFSFFELPPHPPAAKPCVLGLGVGVMGNAGLCSRSAHGLQVPSSFLYILVHFKGLVK